MTAEARLGLLSALCAALIAALLFFDLKTSRLLNGTTAAAERSAKFSLALADLLAAANRMDAADRNQLLFQRQDRAAAEAAKTSFFDQFERAAALAFEGAELTRLRAVRQAFEAAIAEDEKLLATRTPQPGLPAMDRVRDGIAQLQLDAQQAARQTAFTARAQSHTELWFCVFLVVALGGSAAVLVFRIRRELAARARANSDLRRVNLFLDATFESLPLMVFVKEAEKLSFVRINRYCEQLTGMTRAQLLGKTDFDYWPADQAAFFQSKDRATLASGQLTDIVEEPIETAHGRRWLHTKKVPLLDSDGTPLFLLGISEDITDRKREAEELKTAKEAAEATSRELEAFSYSVSHDLRAPLRAIDGFSQALLEDNAGQLNPDGLDSLRRVRAAAQRMGELIDDLLELSRVSRHELKRETVNLSSLARVVTADLVRQNPGREIELTVESGLTAECDARLLRVLLENLFGNAWKFTSKNAAASIEFGRTGGSFFVRDDGAGFDMQYADKLFGAFQRLHGKAEFEGSGIGLATVQRIVHRHGGRIWATSEPAKGATFHFTLSQ
jgi:PAS domain S-box-containing protein